MKNDEIWEMRINSYRTVPVTHSNVALEVEGRTSRESEGLHVSKNLRFVESRVCPSSSEPTNQFFIYRTPTNQFDCRSKYIGSIGVGELTRCRQSVVSFY